MPEQRKRSRMAVSANVILHTEDKAFFLKGRTRDISMTSLYVKSEVAFPLGTKCHIDIIIPGKNAKLIIRLNGSVVRREKDGYGVVFDHDLEFWPLLAMLKP